MPRVALGLADGLIYHIINRGNGRRQVFHTEGDYRAFVDLMTEASDRYPVILVYAAFLKGMTSCSIRSVIFISAHSRS